MDEHISRDVAKEAGKSGVDVQAVDGSDMRGLDDVSILRKAIEKGRIVVTYDIADFAVAYSNLSKEGERIPGLVFVDQASIPSSDIGGLVKALVKLARRITRKEVDPEGGVFLAKG